MGRVVCDDIATAKVDRTSLKSPKADQRKTLSKPVVTTSELQRSHRKMKIGMHDVSEGLSGTSLPLRK